MTMIKTLAAAAFGFAALTGAAFADTGATQTWQSEVRFSADRLADPLAVDALQRDIVTAAKEACGPAGRGVRALQQRNACVRKAVNDAVADVNIASLSVLHANLTASAKFDANRAVPNTAVLQMVAEAGGQSRAAGTIGGANTR